MGKAIKLKEIDTKFSLNKVSLKELMPEFNFKDELSFTLNREEICKSIDTNLKKKSGLYFFELKVDGKLSSSPSLFLEDLKSRWIESSYRNITITDSEGKESSKTKKLSSPKPIDKRIKTYTTLESWLPFYLGKSDDLYHRISQHIEQPWDKSTSSMKLQEREQFHNFDFRVKVLQLEVQNYDMIVPFYESEYRKIFNPIIGKQ